jgi:aspartyl protease/PDZ domain-containing protein
MRSPFALLALTLAIASPSRHGTVPADHAPPRFEMADSVSVPMRLQSGRVLLDVKVNGRGPFPFILDTGAPGSVFDLAFAQELELPLGDSTQVASPGGRGLVARRATIDRLEIGGLTVHGATGAAMAGLPFPPGADSPRGVLSPYRLGELLVTLDYPQGRVVFRRGALPEPDGREVFGWDRNGELPLVPIDVAGHPLRVHLDSGATGGLSLPVALEKELPLSTPVTEIGRARTVDRELVVRGAKLAGAVTLGRYRLEAPNVTFIDVLKDIGNVGPAILQQFVITLDPAHARLRLAGPANGQLRAGEDRPRRYGIQLTAVDANPLQVAGVDAGAPADKAGLRAGDRIVRMNGQPVDSLAAAGRVQALQGSPLRLEVLRGDARLTLEMKLE